MVFEDSAEAKAAVDPVADYFDTESRSQCLGVVAHLVRNADEMAYVSAPARSGKTIFAARLADELADEFQVVEVSVAEGVDLIAEVCEALSINQGGDDWATLLRDVAELRPVLVLVDDADRLTAEALDALLEMHAEGIRLIMVGAAPVAPALAEVVREIDLPPLSESETREYLGFLGRRAGVSVAAVDTARMHRSCGGWPGRLADQMASGTTSSKAALAVPAGAWRWLLVVVLMVVVALAVWFQDEINQVFEGSGPVSSSHTLELPLPAEPIVREDVLPEPLASEPVAVPEPEPEPESVMERSTIEEQVTEQLEKTEVTDEPSAESDDALMAQEASEPVAESSAEIDAPAVPSEPQAPAAETPLPSEMGPEPQPAVQPVRVQLPEPSTVTARDGGVDWLRAQAPDAYTLQLVGAREPAAIQRFIARHQLTGTYAVFERDLAGKPWYSLVLGSYPDRDGAVAARAVLPKALRTDDVWPRTFASIQDVLAKR